MDIYIASISNVLKIHNWSNGELIYSYDSYSREYIKSVSWDRIGECLVYVPGEGSPEIIRVHDRMKLLQVVRGICCSTFAAFQNTMRRNIAVGTTTGTVCIYNTNHKRICRYLPFDEKMPVFQVKFSANDSYLAAAHTNGKIVVYSTDPCSMYTSLSLPNLQKISKFDCHMKRESLIVAGGERGILSAWDINSGGSIYNLQAHTESITDLSFPHNNAEVIGVAARDRRFTLCDMRQKYRLLDKIFEDIPTAIDFCPDKVGLAVALRDGTINVCDVRSFRTPIYEYRAHHFEIKQIQFQRKSEPITKKFNVSEYLSRTARGDNKIPDALSIPDVSTNTDVASISDAPTDPDGSEVSEDPKLFKTQTICDGAEISEVLEILHEQENSGAAEIAAEIPHDAKIDTETSEAAKIGDKTSCIPDNSNIPEIRNLEITEEVSENAKITAECSHNSQ